MTWYEQLVRDTGQFAFAAENLAIMLAYILFGWKIIPLLPLRTVTTWAGRAFFALCALTHLENVLHTYGKLEFMWETWHSQLIHGLQAIAVWVFFTGFFADVKVLMTRHNELVLAAKEKK